MRRFWLNGVIMLIIALAALLVAGPTSSAERHEAVASASPVQGMVPSAQPAELEPLPAVQTGNFADANHRFEPPSARLAAVGLGVKS